VPRRASVSCCFLTVFADQLPGAGIGSDWSFPAQTSGPCSAAELFPSALDSRGFSTKTALAEASWAAVPCLLTLGFLGTGVWVQEERIHTGTAPGACAREPGGSRVRTNPTPSLRCSTTHPLFEQRKLGQAAASRGSGLPCYTLLRARRLEWGEEPFGAAWAD